MARWLYRMLSTAGDVRAASRGPAPYARRKTRAAAHRSLARALRRVRF